MLNRFLAPSIFVTLCLAAYFRGFFGALVVIAILILVWCMVVAVAIFHVGSRSDRDYESEESAPSEAELDALAAKILADQERGEPVIHPSILRLRGRI